jgi:hypothetical protein
MNIYLIIFLTSNVINCFQLDSSLKKIMSGPSVPLVCLFLSYIVAYLGPLTTWYFYNKLPIVLGAYVVSLIVQFLIIYAWTKSEENDNSETLGDLISLGAMSLLLFIVLTTVSLVAAVVIGVHHDYSLGASLGLSLLVTGAAFATWVGAMRLNIIILNRNSQK